MHTKIQDHEFSVPSEILTEPNLLSYCTNRHPSMALACSSTLSIIPSTMIDYPGYLLCNCNPYFCNAKIVTYNVRIKTANTAYAFKETPPRFLYGDCTKTHNVLKYNSYGVNF